MIAEEIAKGYCSWCCNAQNRKRFPISDYELLIFVSRSGHIPIILSLANIINPILNINIKMGDENKVTKMNHQTIYKTKHNLHIQLCHKCKHTHNLQTQTILCITLIYLI